MKTNITGSSVQNTILKTPEQSIQEELKQATPEAPEEVNIPQPSGSSIFDNMKDTIEEQPPTQEQLAPVSQEVGDVLSVMSEEEVQAAPDLWQRKQLAEEEIAAGVDTRRYNPAPTTSLSVPEDGGLFDRADDFTNKILEGSVVPSGIFHPKPQISGQVTVESKLGNLGNIITKLGAVQNGAVAPDFLSMTSIVTENALADLTLGVKPEFDENPQSIQGTAEAEELTMFSNELPDGQPEPTYSVTKAQGNAKLGQDIAKEWQRYTGVQADPLTKEESETLGDAVKELYYEVNKGPETSPFIIRQEAPDGQVEFKVTPTGMQMFSKAEHMRKMMFPKEHVRPLKVKPTERRKPRYSGAKKTDVPLTSEALLDAKEKLESIPHVVDPRRLKILWSTLLPALSGDKNIPLPLLEMVTEIHGMGPSKIKEFEAKAKLAQINKQKNDQRYDPIQNMISLQRSIAQSAYGIAVERSGVNYLTYFIQAYNGRLTPEQTHFNPTTSKQVRFVTANPAKVVVRKGSRQEKNLIQMYAMMLVKDADALLPLGREQAFQRALPELLKDGRRLKEVMTMTNEESEAISQAIEQGIPLNDERFPKLKGLGLDPEADADLIRAIKEKKEDGPAYIDGLMDVVDYYDAMQEGKPFRTRFNAYIDGKTNGIASNAMQLGSKELAYRVGVLRSKDSVYAIDNDIDIRADLADRLTQALNEDGFSESVFRESGGNPDMLQSVAWELFNYKPLNKITTMTYGYGKEIENFRGEMIEALTNILTNPDLTKEHKDGQLLAKVEALAAAGMKGNYASIEEAIVETLFPIYSSKLAEVMTQEGLAARRMMYGASLFHVMMDELFEIKSPIGLPLRYGAMESLGADNAEATEYSIATEGTRRKIKAYHYESRATSSAIRPSDKGAYIGGHAFGGSIPGPVQSIDAATVALSVTGTSWNNLNKASDNNPYVHTIYDAFKLDANGYDVALRDINNEWLNASLNWSYLEETQKALQESYKRFNKRISMMPENDKVSVGMDSGFRMIGYLLQQVDGPNGPYRKNLFKVLQRMGGDRIDPSKALSEFNSKLRSQGIKIDDSPEELTPKQIRFIVTELISTLQYKSRLDKIISFTNKRKQDLRKDIEAGGEAIYQYYTH